MDFSATEMISSSQKNEEDYAPLAMFKLDLS
jgi:hypothetical protein